MNQISAFESGQVKGFLHTPDGAATSGLVLTHGAGANCQAPLLIAVASAFAREGAMVLRCDLPFRQRRKFGPPSPSTSALDREGLREAVAAMAGMGIGTIFLGGHSYGGRQASMLAAEDPDLASRLLLLSYPLHPPNKPSQLRTGHFPALRTPAMFVQGSKDPFGSLEGMGNALKAIAGETRFVAIEGAGHDLKKGSFDLAALVVGPFLKWRE